MAYKMFSIGLIVLAVTGMSLCQQQQLSAGLPSQYFPSTIPEGPFQGLPAAVQPSQTKFEDIGNQPNKLSSSNLEVPRQSQPYQDAVQQQNLAQSYETPFENFRVQYSIDTTNSNRANQDNQQYYVAATQQSAEPQFITKESYSATLPEVIPSQPTIQAQVQPDYKQQFTTPTHTQQDISAANAAQSQQEYRHVDTIAQAQEEYRRQFAALEQAQIEYKQQFAALSQAQQELKQRFSVPVEAQQELKHQFSVLAQAQQEYKRQFSALSQAQKEYKQQFAVLNEAQQELKKQFAVPIQAQLEYKQQFADLAQAQLESRQQFAALVQAQKEFKQQFVATALIPHEYTQRFSAPAQQVYKQQYAVPDQGRQDYRQRFGGPAPRYQYNIQKPATVSATGPVNNSYVAAAQPKFQKYYTVPTAQVTVTEQPRVQQPATTQSSSVVVISTTQAPLKESVIYNPESTPTPRQQRKVDYSNLRVIA
ncbi:RNA polymerase II degradation factor 1-like [Myzus persicae]|uniref:RNA polymerase II degradation factor 1-like n=1 Tax=Myzus persicae TaxID=13164 RepID=UPI000B9393E7|nr:RNA polymerase II degradation factor 1-like [Myzus persicae]